MEACTDTILNEEVLRARLALLLQHFSKLDDGREPWRVVYPLKEVLLLVACATIASCDDFDDVVAWGKHHLAFLQGFSEFDHGIPCERRLRALVNRVDPILFGHCFNSWIAALWPARHEFIAIDGKTSRRTHDQRKGLNPDISQNHWLIEGFNLPGGRASFGARGLVALRGAGFFGGRAAGAAKI